MDGHDANILLELGAGVAAIADADVEVDGGVAVGFVGEVGKEKGAVRLEDMGGADMRDNHVGMPILCLRLCSRTIARWCGRRSSRR